MVEIFLSAAFASRPRPDFAGFLEAFFAAGFLLADFLAADFFAVDFLAVDFFAVDFLAADFFAVDFLAVDFFAVDFFFAADFLAAGFLEVLVISMITAPSLVRLSIRTMPIDMTTHKPQKINFQLTKKKLSHIVRRLHIFIPAVV